MKTKKGKRRHPNKQQILEKTCLAHVQHNRTTKPLNMQKTNTTYTNTTQPTTPNQNMQQNT